MIDLGFQVHTSVTMSKNNKNTLVYIAADSRSGSTLLDLLIGNHSKVVSIGELRRLREHYSGNYACTCGVLFGNCNFWSAVERRLNSDDRSLVNMVTLIPRSKNVLHDLSYLLPGFLIKRLSQNIPWLFRDIGVAQNNLQIADAICEENQSQYLVDSSKVFKFSRLFHLLRPKRTKTIFLIRDGRGVCYSRRRHGSNVKSSAKVWVASQIKFFFLKMIIPKKHKLTVYYENLCRHPEEEMQQICRFIGVPFEQDCVELVKRDKHNICGSPMRFKTDDTRIQLDETWRSELTDEEKTQFRRSGAGIINWMLGYRS